MSTDYPGREFTQDVVEGIIRDYITVGLATADSGMPDGLDKKTWEACISQIKNLHLAEPHLPATQILNALALAGVDRD